jgi:ubiquinone/menaquinone biosynthesis C-methylase UbiE
MIELIDPQSSEVLEETDAGLVTKSGQLLFRKEKGAYRIVTDDNYATNFGLEWNTFQKTQIDKYSGNDISRKRFFAETRWESDLAGENMLEVGSGAGRFSQIILDHTKATLYSVDFSNAVEANFKNNGPNPRLKLFQASIYELPFRKHSFDKVICLGVLQHTPDFQKSIACLCEMIKPGGELVVDFYPVKGWYTKLCAKYMLRPVTKNMDHDKLMRLIRKNIDAMMNFYKFNVKIGLGALNRFVPICDVDRTIPAGLSEQDLREWIILDTFDMFSPQFDKPQRLATVAEWCQSGLVDIDAQFIKYDHQFEAATVKARMPL